MGTESPAASKQCDCWGKIRISHGPGMMMTVTTDNHHGRYYGLTSNTRSIQQVFRERNTRGCMLINLNLSKSHSPCQWRTDTDKWYNSIQRDVMGEIVLLLSPPLPTLHGRYPQVSIDGILPFLKETQPNPAWLLCITSCSWFCGSVIWAGLLWAILLLFMTSSGITHWCSDDG